MMGLGVKQVFGLALLSTVVAGVATPAGAEGIDALSWEDRVACHLVVETVMNSRRARPEGVAARAPAELRLLAEQRANRVHEVAGFEESELNAELDRILESTRDARTLSAMLQALGDDRDLALECIARPILAERVLKGHALSLPPELSGTRSAATPIEQLRGSSVSCEDDTWSLTSTGAGSPTERSGASAVWTGVEMIVWGGFEQFGTPEFPVTGGRYVPATNSWSATSTQGVPTGGFYRGFWTGTHMLLWGSGSVGTWEGALYDPVGDSWASLSTVAAPSLRANFAAVWTGTDLLIWGGRQGATYFGDGGRFNLASGSWSPMAAIDAPSARERHRSVWTGSELVVWGGKGPGAVDLQDGGRYNPVGDTWSSMSSVDGPTAGVWSLAAWTGDEMLVWDDTVGGRYSPISDSWSPITLTNAPPSATTGRQAVWDGWEWILWGLFGSNQSREPGARYDPRLDQWMTMSTVGAPTDRVRATAVWTGRQAIFWGGSDSGSPNSNVGGLYCAETPVFVDGFESGDTNRWVVE